MFHVRWGRTAKTGIIGLTVLLLVLPSYVSAYRVHGASNAPSFLWGDVVLVNHAAYEIRFPYTGWRLFGRAGPRRGDMVLLRLPDRHQPVLRRILALPGDSVQLVENRLILNGLASSYRTVSASDFAGVEARNALGSSIELETAPGQPHFITYMPGACSRASFGPLTLGPGEYFLLGDNRDRCQDSRNYGPIDRSRILGRVVAHVDAGD